MTMPHRPRLLAAIIGLSAILFGEVAMHIVSAQRLTDPGQFSCAEWSRVRQADPSPLNPVTAAVTAWVQGYFVGGADLAFLFVSRVPTHVADDLRAGFTRMQAFQTAEGIPTGLDDYCVAHPDDRMTMAAKRLLRKAYTATAAR